MAKKKQDEALTWDAPDETWNSEDNAWYQQAKQTAQALRDRTAFSYDPAADPLYRAAKNQYLTQGRRAMEDVLGRTASLSGGYASSYGQTHAAQAYDDQLLRLASLLPDYYERARTAYDKETKALQDELGTAIGLYDKDYQVWLDKQSARERQAKADREADQWERQFAADNEQWERRFAEDHDRWAAEQDQWEQRFATDNDQWERQFAADNDQWERKFSEDHDRWVAELAQEAEECAAKQAASAASQSASEQANARSYAYRMAMLALQQGLSVSDTLLETAGIDKAYAETIRRYYYNLRNQN